MSESTPERREPYRSEGASQTPVNRPPGPSEPVPGAAHEAAARPKRSSAQIRADMERQRHDLSSSVDHLRDRVTELTDWRSQIKKHRKSIVVGAVATGFVVGGLMALRRR